MGIAAKRQQTVGIAAEYLQTFDLGVIRLGLVVVLGECAVQPTNH
jgi:hypothetical protein